MHILYLRSVDENRQAPPLSQRPGFREAEEKFKEKRARLALLIPVSERKRLHDRIDPSLQEYLSGSAQFVQNTSQKNIISHPLHPGGHQAQHGGDRLRGAKVGTHGTRTGGKTTNGQTNGEKRQL